MEVKNNNDMENLQTDLNRLWKWAVENAMKIKSKK
jgi:electron transfer flavoprotein alpha/beta subunit